MADNNITYEIQRHLGVVDTTENGWRQEVNIVSWNGGKPKIDIRTWSPDHERMTKGLTLTPEQARKVADILTTKI